EGKARVIMQTEEYKEKLRELLDTTTYRKLKQELTNKITKQANMLVRSSSLYPNVIQQICKTETLSPRLCGLPKSAKTQPHSGPLFAHWLLN
ncbi:hypothetical protein JRQ81_009546, partial [Phrynocephalus forsythii]